jgi:hypothetical protein
VVLVVVHCGSVLLLLEGRDHGLNKYLRESFRSVLAYSLHVRNILFVLVLLLAVAVDHSGRRELVLLGTQRCIVVLLAPVLLLAGPSLVEHVLHLCLHVVLVADHLCNLVSYFIGAAFLGSALERVEHLHESAGHLLQGSHNLRLLLKILSRIDLLLLVVDDD